MTKARVKGTDAAKYVKSAAQLQKVEAKVIIFFSFEDNNILWFPLMKSVLILSKLDLINKFFLSFTASQVKGSRNY